MKRWIVGAAVLLLASQPTVAAAQDAAVEIVGTWRLVAATQLMADWTVTRQRVR